VVSTEGGGGGDLEEVKKRKGILVGIGRRRGVTEKIVR